MSATGRNLPGHERDPRDFYRTPAWATRAVWKEIIAAHPAYLPEWTVLDAGCGDGAILSTIRTLHAGNSVGVEKDPALACEARREHDAIDIADFLRLLVSFDVVVMNPPFAGALDFARHAVTRIAPVVAMLGRIGFIETQERFAFLREYPCDVHILPARPKFAHRATDSTIYAWFVWGLSPGGRWTVLEAADRPQGRLRAAGAR